MTLTDHAEEGLALAGRRVLITGAAGFIGTSIVRRLGGVDCEILRLARTPRPMPQAGPRCSVKDLAGDVRDEELWRNMPLDVDVVFHLAGQTSTYEANRDPPADLRHNVLPLVLMLQALKTRASCPVLVCASTATICGLPRRLPVDDEHPDCPLTVYDLHKQMAEQYLAYYVRDGAVRGGALRLANVYGPGPRSSRADRGVLNQMVGRALRGEPLTVYGRGEQVRDYVHVDDVARAFLRAAAHAAGLNGSHFVIGSGAGHSIAQALGLVADRVKARTGKAAAVTHVDPPAGLSPIESRNFVADSSAFSRITGWRARYDLAKGIDTIIDELL